MARLEYHALKQQKYVNNTIAFDGISQKLLSCHHLISSRTTLSDD